MVAKFKLTFLMLLGLYVAQGQTGTIRGFLKDEGTSEPIVFTTVQLKGTAMAGSTNEDGYFSITKVPAGDYVLVVNSIQHEAIEHDVTLKPGQILKVDLKLKESAQELGAVVVDAEREAKKNNVRVSVNRITPKEIQLVAAPGGEADLATYLQVLPGVVFTGDQGGQLYIRGGAPIQNKVLLDGMTVYNPFHSIGFFSVFDTDIIRSADIYTGGFGAAHGGRISSIMDIRTREGNQKRTSGKVSVSPFMAKALVEGPLGKPKEEGTKISYLLTGKHSYLEQSSQALYNYVDSAGLPFNFTDLYGKISFAGESGSKFNLYGYNFRDQVKYQAVSDLNWNAWGVGSSFMLVPVGNPVIIEGKLSVSEYRIEMEEEGLTDQLDRRYSKVNGATLGFDFTYFQRLNEVKYGIEINSFRTDFSFVNPLALNIEQVQNTTEIAAYLTYKLNKGPLVLEPGFRLQHYASLGELSPEPRLGAKYNMTEKIRLKLAAGVYSQNLIATNSDRDVVNLFYGFLSGPDNLQKEFVTENNEVKDVTSKLQKANHLIVGGEFDLTDKLSLNIEGYYKWFNQLTNMNRNKIYEDNEDNYYRPDVFKKDFIIETGLARGVDMVLKYSSQKFYLWCVYSLGKVERWDGLITYAPVFDRRHNVNLVGTYKFGTDLVWEVDARWNLGSGLPFTQTQGYYEQWNPTDGGVGTPVETNNGNLGILYANLNGGRLPYYHRFDLTIKRRINFSERSVLEMNASVTNLYSRENIFYVNRVTGEKVYQLPIMPSIGLNWKF